jgi:large subunit ribosomal protein L17
MAAALFEHGAIRTTEAKAKELRRFVERIITQARRGTLHARRLDLRDLGHDRDIYNDEGERQELSIVQKLFNEIAPRYVDRPGGYTRIIRLAERRIGDAGVQVILQLVEKSAAHAADQSQGQSRRSRRAAVRRAAIKGAAPHAAAKPAEEESHEQPAEGAETPAEQAAEATATPPAEQSSSEEPKKE